MRHSVATVNEGIFVVGCCQGPKDISDIVAQASSTAARALAMISKGKVEIEAAIVVINEEPPVKQRRSYLQTN